MGRTNVGKSTLVNGIVGEKVGIVTPKPQTTRNVIRGIYTEERGQAVFLDTPGIHRPRTRMNRNMVRMAYESIEGVDAVLWILDAGRPWLREEEELAKRLADSPIPLVLAVNKVDLVKDKKALLPLLEELAGRFPDVPLYPTCALDRDYDAGLLEILFPLLPEGEPLFPEDLYTDQLERQLAAEIVREQLFLRMRDEVPHCTGVLVEQFQEPEEGRDLLRIGCSILVERESQKPILIGKGGRTLKAVGTQARQDLMKILGCRVHLELWVKVRPHWRENVGILREMGLA